MNKQINRTKSSSAHQLFEEYKPSILFLLRFLGIYVLGNIAYGIWIIGYGTIADPVTQFITANTAWGLNVLGSEVTTFIVGIAPNVSLQLNGDTVLNVYEGCNAINVSILFVAFLFAYKRELLKTILFAIIGIIAIYLFNIIRLIGLFLVAVYFQEQFYFTHKFLFTGVIYAFVFFLWFLWVAKFNSKETKNAKSMTTSL